MDGEIVVLILVIALLVVSVGIHEAAHGWVAWKCGDRTAKDLGRVTLNPIVHIDPFMTILLPTMLFLGSNGQMIFGGAKPVPVAFHRLRHPWRDMSLVALAGPTSNFLLAVLFFILYRVAVEFLHYERDQVLPLVLIKTVELNLLLAAFNLIPIPPLDGSRLMAWLLPDNLRDAYLRLETIGMILVIALIYLGPLRPLVFATMDVMYDWVLFLATLGGLW